jgi:hypothetical protein
VPYNLVEVPEIQAYLGKSLANVEVRRLPFWSAKPTFWELIAVGIKHRTEATWLLFTAVLFSSNPDSQQARRTTIPTDQKYSTGVRKKKVEHRADGTPEVVSSGQSLVGLVICFCFLPRLLSPRVARVRFLRDRSSLFPLYFFDVFGFLVCLFPLSLGSTRLRVSRVRTGFYMGRFIGSIIVSCGPISTAPLVRLTRLLFLFFFGCFFLRLHFIARLFSSVVSMSSKLRR